MSALCSCALALTPVGPALSAPDSVTIRFPASRDPEIRSAQEVLVQAWGYVREYYFDPTFNKQDWKQRLQDALTMTFKASSRQEALQAVETLLASLDDPFTRVLLPGGDSEAFEAQTQAKIISTGLVAGRPEGTGSPLQVVYVVPGSPAAEAGLRAGDTIAAVNGRPVVQQEDSGQLQEELRQDREVQLKVLRSVPEQSPAGAAGTASASGRDAPGSVGARSSRRSAIRAAALASGGVLGGPTAESTPASPSTLPASATAAAPAGSDGLDSAALQHSAEGAGVRDGDAANGSAAASSSSTSSEFATGMPSMSYPLVSRFIDVRLQPAPVEFVPVQYAVLARGQGPGGGPGSGGGAAAEAAAAASVASVPPAPSPARVGYIRIVAFTENVAKEVEAAVRTLKASGCGSWLLDVRANPGGIVREGLGVAELLMRPGQVFAVVRDRSGTEQVERLADDAQALLDGQPVAVLVDRYSASTSELLAGALHDDAGALLVGERTYGKGRTQRVVQLNGGVTLLVSTDTYVTPARRVVDRVGLAPDVTCRPGPPPSPVARPVASASASAAAVGNLAGSDQGGVEIGSDDAVERAGVELEQVDGLLRDPCVRAAVGKLTRGTAARGR